MIDTISIPRQSSAWYEHDIVVVDQSPGLSTMHSAGPGGGYLKTTIGRLSPEFLETRFSSPDSEETPPPPGGV